MNNKYVRWISYVIIGVLLVWYVTSIITNKQKTRDPNTLLLWIAPNEVQAKFWDRVVSDWNKSGQGLKVEYRTIQTAGSSEESILNSLVSKTNPDICDNIFAGFLSQLASLDTLYSLNDYDGYGDLVKDRKMEKIMKGWAINGKNYVFPMYSNPVMYWWRMDKLKEYGFDKPPRTYSELIEIAKKVTIPYKQYAIRLFVGKMWWDRNSDFIASYYAASSGKPYIENNKAVFNNEYSKKVLGFYKEVFNNKWTIVANDVSNVYWEGKAFGVVKGAWDIDYASRTYPEVFKNTEIAPVLVPDDHKGPGYTLADSKGLVIFNTCKKPEEAWNFLKFVFKNEEYSKLWLELTGMPPARGDLMTNPLFENYYRKHKYAKAYAEYVATAMPPAMITNTIDVQQAMTNEIMEPLMYDKKTRVDDVLNESTEKINSILEKSNI